MDQEETHLKQETKSSECVFGRLDRQIKIEKDRKTENKSKKNKQQRQTISQQEKKIREKNRPNNPKYPCTPKNVWH